MIPREKLLSRLPFDFPSLFSRGSLERFGWKLLTHPSPVADWQLQWQLRWQLRWALENRITRHAKKIFPSIFLFLGKYFGSLLRTPSHSKSPPPLKSLIKKEICFRLSLSRFRSFFMRFTFVRARAFATALSVTRGNKIVMTRGKVKNDGLV